MISLSPPALLMRATSLESDCRRTEPSMYSFSSGDWDGLSKTHSWLCTFQVPPLPAARSFLALRTAEHTSVYDFWIMRWGWNGIWKWRESSWTPFLPRDAEQ